MTKQTSYLEARGPAGEEIRVPVASVIGASDGPTLLVVAGVHGSEYDAIEATKRLFQSVDSAELSGRLHTVPCLNVPAFYGLAMHVNPVDGMNPGRAFPGDTEGSYTERMVRLVWDHLAESADVVIDVHGGDLEEELVEYSQVNLTGNDNLDARAEAFARALDFPFFVRRPPVADPPATGGLHAIAAAEGKVAVLTEAGSHGQLDERTVAVHSKALRNALLELEMLPGSPIREVESPTVLRRFVGVAAPTDGFWYPAVTKGATIHKGDALGEMRDMFDQPLVTVTSEEDAAILGVMTIPPRRKGDMLMGVGTFD